VETAAERMQRRSLVTKRLQGRRPGTCNDPDARAAPYTGHPAALVDAGLYPVLAVIEDLYQPRPIDVARVLTLDRSTVIRHLKTLERRRLVYFDRGISRRRRPRVLLTVEGYGAMKAIRQARVERLDRVVRSWTEAQRRTTTDCLASLARRLHDDVEPASLPPELSERSRRTTHRLLPAVALQDHAAGRGRRSWP
jgi:DNA-binding MarR family transcriptional regulator